MNFNSNTPSEANMKKTIINILLIVILAVSVAALAFMIFLRSNSTPAAEPEPTPTPTPVATPKPSEPPKAEYFTISLVGDNSLSASNISSSFKNTINGDMKYPYKNTLKYFENDDLTIANLECVFSDNSLSSGSMFSFKAPTSYAQILIEGSVEFVTTANNHSLDFGQKGLDDTCAALKNYGIAYGTENSSTVYETESGLKVGIYCAHSAVSVSAVEAGVKALKDQNVDYIICALHWGSEGKYRASDTQVLVAHAAIDAGANIVYGSHPHVLQPVEEYGDGIIFYSLGNWSFGGNNNPKDKDTAIAQITVKRDLDGTVTTDSYELIPCCISSDFSKNDFCPTPYEKGSDEYKRTMTKLDGSFKGADLYVDYSFMNPTPAPTASESPEPSAEPSAEPSTNTETPTEAPTETPAESPPVTETATES